MSTRVPNCNFLAELVSEIKKEGSQNFGWGTVPLGTTYGTPASVHISLQTNFQLHCSISLGHTEGSQNLGWVHCAPGTRLQILTTDPSFCAY